MQHDQLVQDDHT